MGALDVTGVWQNSQVTEWCYSIGVGGKNSHFCSLPSMRFSYHHFHSTCSNNTSLVYLLTQYLLSVPHKHKFYLLFILYCTYSMLLTMPLKRTLLTTVSIEFTQGYIVVVSK